jgi:hypothetical protein
MTTFLLISLSLHSHQQLHVASPPQQAHPGAFPVRGSRITPQHDSFLNGDNNPATLFNAELVVDSELASSASLVDVEAEETAQCQRQVKTALLIFLVIDIFVSIPIQLHQKLHQ